MICGNCNTEVPDNTSFCGKCGANLSRQNNYNNSNNNVYTTNNPEPKDWLTTLLLCLFLGGLGIHRFYTGFTTIGVIQLLTAGGCGVWVLIDLINIITNNYRDAYGQPLVRKTA